MWATNQQDSNDVGKTRTGIDSVLDQMHRRREAERRIDKLAKAGSTKKIQTLESCIKWIMFTIRRVCEIAIVR